MENVKSEFLYDDAKKNEAESCTNFTSQRREKARHGNCDKED